MSDNPLDDIATEIHVRPSGPLLARGGIDVRRATIVKSEHGEPMTYDIHEPLETGEVSALCRCGDSSNKPFCDGSHNAAGFEGLETAEGTYAGRSNVLGSEAGDGTNITIRDDRSICVHAGFCGTTATNVWKMADGTDDTGVRIQAINMIEKCPSGALTYSLAGREDANEQPLPTEVLVIDDGPLYVQGGIPVVSAEGEGYEVRNRVTLCRCGASANKPFCDGAHTDAGFADS